MPHQDGASALPPPGVVNRWASLEGTPAPLGVEFIAGEDAYNFAIYAKHACDVRLLLFSEREVTQPLHTYRFDPRINKTGRVWHCRIPARSLEGAVYYAFQIDGSRDLFNGHRYDPDKLLLDPYARAIYFPPEFSREAARHPGCNAGRAPLGVLTSGRNAAFDWSGDRTPRHTHDLIIYELHVRGFTKRASSGVGAAARGTFAGLQQKIPYLRELGITAVELMPVFQYDPLEGNYWGYMPLSFFALHNAYGMRNAFDEELDEFKCLVKALHQADLEVILDVVYNHTAEGNELGPTYSYRGIDNSTYYLLETDRRRYRNDSGTGNVLNTANHYVRGMILESLRYWVREFHVDGFRFDLASLFTRRDDGSISLDDPPIIAAIQSDPVLSGTRLIAEAWDISSYQLGRAFPGVTWLQWNGRFRDDIRSFCRGDPGFCGAAMSRLYGSDDLFPDSLIDSYHAYQSVNYITSHDGFCLYDLLSYSAKRNDANGHGNLDGTDDNRSWNCGWEGDDGAPAWVLARRVRQAKNLLCLLLLANGTPLLRAGDEFLNTQRGNNNPYNQDNETSWLDWDLVSRHQRFLRFAKGMIAFRKQHPSLGRSRFWREDVIWFGPTGRLDPQLGQFSFLLKGASQGDADLYVMVNMTDCDGESAMPQSGDWHVAIDTSRDSPDDLPAPSRGVAMQADTARVPARAVMVLISPGR